MYIISFFFNVTATTEIYTLSLHDALPIFCPAGQTLTRKQLARKDRAVIYAAQPEVCGACALKGRCTARSRRFVTRHLHEAALQGMDQRATSEDRKSTRLNSSHLGISYAVFCL